MKHNAGSISLKHSTVSRCLSNTGDPALRFLAKNSYILADFFLSEIGGYSPLPLNRKSLCPKQLSGKGGVPHPTPLNGKPLCSKKLNAVKNIFDSVL